MRRTHAVILWGIRVVLVAIALLFGVRCLVDPGYTKYGAVLASLALPFLPVVAERLFKVKIAFRLQVIYYVFLFVAQFMGIDMDFYKSWPAFDKVTHLISGVLSVLLAHYVLVFFKMEKGGSKLFRVFFMVCFAMAVGVVWEFFEFGCDKLLGQRMQQLISVGVDDTMLDLLAATVGAVVGSVWLVGQKSLRFFEK